MFKKGNSVRFVMRVFGANIFIREHNYLVPSQLVKISYIGEDHYYQRDHVSQDFFPLEGHERHEAEVRLQGTLAKPFIPPTDLQRGFASSRKSFDRSMKDENKEALRFHIEGFLEIMAEKDLLGQEE